MNQWMPPDASLVVNPVPAPPPAARVAAQPSPLKLLLPALVGAAIAVLCGVYGKTHDPTGETVFTLVFSKTIAMKAWMATIAVALALFQVWSALRMWGKVPIPRTQPRWWGDAHRLSGTLAFVASLPVAYHCLWSLGFADNGGRAVVHSVVGCLFYGAFAAKMVVVRVHGHPGWVLPVVGALTFAALVVVWYTSAVWYWSNFEFPGF